MPYPEEAVDPRGMQNRDESYPRGKTAKLPAGSLSMKLPGRGDNVRNYGQAKMHPRSAAYCADEMRVLVPGCDGLGTVDRLRE